jgi:exosortase
MATQARPEEPRMAAPSSSSARTAPSALSARWELIGIGILMLVAFWPILRSMYGSWFDEAAFMEHGILVAPAAAYMAWSKKDRLQTVVRRPSAWGLVLLLWGAGQAIFGIVAQWVWVSRMSFLISLVGLIALVYGWKMVKELAYPLCTLILMVAPPTFIFERLTLSLQLLASRLGEVCLEALGYSVLREGNILEMVGIKLSVEEACSGIRSLMAIFFMCVLYNFFFVAGTWMRTFILVMAIPIAILGNAVRIVATGVASQYNKALAEGAAHEAFGYVSVLVAAMGCVALHLGASSAVRHWRNKHG